MKISNISPERDVNNESIMNGGITISLNKLFKLSGQELGNIIIKHKLRLHHTMS